MLKKLSLVMSLAAALALGIAFATPDAALAQQHQHHNNAHSKYVVGHRYNGHVWYGHSSHRWHGRSYAYGVGPCWINAGGLWFWNVAACP